MPLVFCIHCFGASLCLLASLCALFLFSLLFAPFYAFPTKFKQIANGISIIKIDSLFRKKKEQKAKSKRQTKYSVEIKSLFLFWVQLVQGKTYQKDVFHTSTFSVIFMCRWIIVLTDSFGSCNTWQRSKRVPRIVSRNKSEMCCTTVIATNEFSQMAWKKESTILRKCSGVF